MTTPSEEKDRTVNNHRTCALSLSTVKFVISGMFTISRLIGFSQFMVFMILRVIIGGSLGGRLYGDDPSSVMCALANSKSENSETGELDYHHAPLTARDVEKEDLRMDCLMKTYSYFSPLDLWAAGLLTVLLPWISLLPWTPLRYDQEHITCPWINVQWPCLTIYIVRFLRACVRLLLEFAFFLITPILYGRGIPEEISCYDDRVKCTIALYTEKTYFVWLLTLINAVACSLTVAELVDMCRHAEYYEGERSIYKPATKFSSNNSASSTTNTSNDRYNTNRKKIYRYLSVPPNVNGIHDKNQFHNNKYEESQLFSGPESHKRRLGNTRATVNDTNSKSKFRGRNTHREMDVVITLASFKENKMKQLSTKEQLQMTECKETASEDKENIINQVEGDASVQIISNGKTSNVNGKN